MFSYKSLHRFWMREKVKIVFFICVIVSLSVALTVVGSADCVQAAALTGEAKTQVSNSILLRDLITEIVSSYSQVICIAIEPLFALLTNAFLGFVNAAIGLPIDMVTTPLSYPLVLIAFFIVVFVGKILLSFDSTRIFAILTYGELEKIIGYFSVLIISVYSTFRVFSFCNEHFEGVSALLGTTGASDFYRIVPLIGSILSSILALILYYIVKTVILCAEVMQLPLSFLPGISFLFEAAKSCVVLVLCVINLLFPIAGFLLNTMVVVISIILFVKCNYVSQFYRTIYLNPILHSAGIGKPEKEIIHTKLPDYIKDYFEDKKMLLSSAMPAYIMHVPMSQKNMKPYECWWYVTTVNNRYLCKKKRFSNELCILCLDDFDKIYFKESFRYMEFFTLDGPEENLNRIFKKPQKDLHFILGHDSMLFYDTVLKNGGYIDYLALKTKLKEEENRKRFADEQVKTESMNQKQQVI